MRKLFLLIIFTTLSCSSGNEVTVYPLICTEYDLYEGEIVRGKCFGKWIAGNRSVFRVFSERQIVVRRRPDISLDPIKYTNCVVASSKDWKCTHDDGSGSFGFREGKYWESSPYEKIIHVNG